VTTQLFSLQGVDAGAVPDLPGAEVEVVGRLGRPVLFGDLWGNEFEVTVAEPDAPERAGAVTADLAAFATGGLGADGGEVTGDRGGSDDPTTVAVPNYFGIQRFGSLRPVTHEVGLAVVREDWEAAVLAYVGAPDDREPADTREARAYAAETRDWRGALERFPRRLDHERAMLAALAEGESFRTALERVPTNLQRLFVHAAQSFAFNRIVSERLDRGLPLTRPVAGDVVAFVDRSAPDLAVPDTDRLQRVETGQLDRVARHCERGRAFVTGPLVGTDTDLADGEPGELVRSVLSDLELAPGAFDLPGEFDSTGDRRALAVRTDLRVGREPLRFSFALPPGSYATTLLREYLKCDPTQL
jgi:tRNA pseudouridine13 synthase